MKQDITCWPYNLHEPESRTSSCFNIGILKPGNSNSVFNAISLTGLSLTKYLSTKHIHSRELVLKISSCQGDILFYRVLKSCTLLENYFNWNKFRHAPVKKPEKIQHICSLIRAFLPAIRMLYHGRLPYTTKTWCTKLDVCVCIFSLHRLIIIQSSMYICTEKLIKINGHIN